MYSWFIVVENKMWFMIPYYIIVCRYHYQHENRFLIFDLKRIRKWYILYITWTWWKMQQICLTLFARSLVFCVDRCLSICLVIFTIVLYVLRRLTSSDYLLVSSILSCNLYHCVVCPSSTYVFWLPFGIVHLVL